MKKPSGIKLKPINLFYLIGWILVFMPPIFFHISGSLTYLIRIANLAYTMILVVMFATKGKKLNRRSAFWFLFLLSVWETLEVVMQSPDQFQVFFYTMLLPPIEVFLMIYCLAGRKGNDIKSKFSSLIFMSKMYILVNAASIILFPHGIISTSLGSSVERANWFLGSKNNQTNYLLLSSIVLMLFLDTKKERKKSVFYVAVAFVCNMFTDELGLSFMGGSSTGIVSLGFLLLISVIYYFKDERIFLKLNSRIVYIAALAVNFILISGTTIPFLVSFVEKVLKKSLTFSNRTFIWERVMYYIYQKPLIGYGEQQIWFAVKLSNLLDGTTYVYNMILKIILDFGIVGFILFSIPILKMKKSETKRNDVLLFGLAAFMISGLMNEIGMEYFFLIVFMYEVMENNTQSRRQEAPFFLNSINREFVK